MKVVLHQIRHHLSILWWKILLLYGLEFTFLNFSDNFHCVYQEIHDYPKETDMSFLMLLFFVVPVLLIAFLQLYTWYQKGKVRWQLVMQQHFLQVIANIIVIAGILMIGYLLFYGIYYKHSIAYLATNIKVNDVSPVFWQMVKQQTIMAKLLPVNVLSFISMILLIVQLSSLLVAAVMTLWKEQVKPITKMYLIFSLCVCFLRITYTTEYFQILFYTLCIFANIGVATQCWERKKQEVRTC